jgi:hypothetical protein
MLVPSWGKLFSDLEEDGFQHFTKEEVRMSETINLVDVFKEFENTDEENLEDRL